MSYKSEWISILAKFKTEIKSHLENPNTTTMRALEKAKNEFIAFVNGHSALLRANTYDTTVIDFFNQVCSNENHMIASHSNTISGLQKLINSIDTAIVENKEEEKMTTNYNVNGNAQIGDNNSQNNTHNTTDININLQTLINEIEKSGDPEAKSKLLDFLNNGTVASILGVTAAEITKFFG